jgi:hypothetical protein
MSFFGPNVLLFDVWPKLISSAVQKYNNYKFCEKPLRQVSVEDVENCFNVVMIGLTADAGHNFKNRATIYT